MAPSGQCRQAVSFGELLAKAKGIKEADVAAEAKEKPMKTKKEKVAKPKAKPREAREAVKVKKELKVKRAKAKAKKEKEDKDKPKAKAKAKAKVKVTKELEKGKKARKIQLKKIKRAVRKKEKHEGQSTQDWCKGFYKHQVAFINEVVDNNWTVCWGALGTGLVGVHIGDKQKKPAEKLQRDDLLILFRNAPSCSAQRRGNKTLAGYGGGMLDIDEQTLEWSSQRKDTNNTIIEKVIDHISGGGKALVAVRPCTSKEYRLLGQISKVDNIKLACCLVEHDAEVIYEATSGICHVALQPNCLRDSPKGVLSVQRWDEDNDSIRSLCKHCCFRTPSAVFHFEDLEPAGVEAYTEQRRVVTKRKQIKEEEKKKRRKKVGKEKEEEQETEPELKAVKEEPEDAPRPKWRITSKQPLVIDEASEPESQPLPSLPSPDAALASQPEPKPQLTSPEAEPSEPPEPSEPSEPPEPPLLLCLAASADLPAPAEPLAAQPQTEPPRPSSVSVESRDM